MKQYEKYKMSMHQGVIEIPIDWIETKIKYLFDIGRGRVISQQELVLEGKYPVYSSQTKGDGCMGYINTFDFDEKGILTWTTDGANAGEVFKRTGQFNCTNVCGTLKPIKDIDLDYYLYFLKNITPFYKRPDTNGAKIMNNEMAEIYAIIPTLNEQCAIARYLDYTIGNLDELIAEKERFIVKLNEKRKAVINEVITRGLKPDAPMRCSGIEWLGDIPAHWELIKLKHLTLKIGSGVTPTGGAEVYQSKGVLFIRSQNVYNDGLRLDDVAYISDEIDNSMANSRVCKNDVLLNITGASMGRCCFVENIGRANVNQHVCIIRPLTNMISTKYLHLVLCSEIGQNQMELVQNGGNREGLNFENLKNFQITHISINEQTEIVNFIEAKTAKIDKLVAEITQQIEKLKEYKTSVISEAVTGKVDLRDWKSPKTV